MKGKEISRTDLAAFYGVTTRTIHDWEKSGLPIVSRGGGGRSNTYNSLQAHEFLVNREISKRVISSDGKQYDKQEEEARLKHHQANNEALKEAEAVGRLLDSVVVVDMCSALVSNSRSRLLVIPNAIKNTFPHIEQELIDSIENAIIEALNELGKDGIPDSLSRVMGQYSFDMDSTPETDD